MHHILLVDRKDISSTGKSISRFMGSLKWEFKSRNEMFNYISSTENSLGIKLKTIPANEFDFNHHVLKQYSTKLLKID